MSDTLLVTTPMILKKNNQGQYEITFLYYSVTQTDGMPTEKKYRLYEHSDSDFSSMTNIFPIYIPADSDYLFINTTPYEFLPDSATVNEMPNTFSLLDNNNSNIANPIVPGKSYYKTKYYVYLEQIMSTQGLATNPTTENKLMLLENELNDIYDQFKLLSSSFIPNQQILTNILTKITDYYKQYENDNNFILEQKKVGVFLSIITIEIQHRKLKADVTKSISIDSDNYYTVYSKGLTNNKLAIIYILILTLLFIKLIILSIDYKINETYNRYINIFLYSSIIITFVLQNYGLFYDLFH